MTRPEEIIEILRTRILDLEYPAGTPLREEHLSRELGASRRTVRDALIALAASGLVEREPNRGGRVRRFSAEDIADLYQARRAWETFGASHADAASDASVQAVQRAYAALERAARSEPDSAEHARLDMDFHRTIAALAGSPRLDRGFSPLAEEMTFAIRLLQHAETESTLELEDQLEQHRAISDAVARRDAAGAVTAVERHISVNRARLLALTDQPIAPAS